MKQHITKEQWNELTKKQKDFLIKWFNFAPELTIGQMIEFLGRNIYAIERLPERKVWTVAIIYKTDDGQEETTNGIRKQNLVDALWEAVKEKLNN